MLLGLCMRYKYLNIYIFFFKGIAYALLCMRNLLIIEGDEDAPNQGLCYEICIWICVFKMRYEYNKILQIYIGNI